MKVLILGANGYLGPHVVKALEGEHELRITDIKPPPAPTRHEFRRVDITNFDQVTKAAEGQDAILNLAVLRGHRKIAFDVNTIGCYNVMLAAVKHRIRRVINTGPHFTVAGPSYEAFDFALHPDAPPQSGLNLYAHSKSLGQEVCRVFTEQHDIWVQDYLFYNFRFRRSAQARRRRRTLHRLVGRRGRSVSPGREGAPRQAAVEVRSLFHSRRHAARQVSQRQGQGSSRFSVQG